MFHIHAIVEECETMGLQHQLTPIPKSLPSIFLLINNGDVVVVHIQVCVHDNQWILANGLM